MTTLSRELRLQPRGHFYSAKAGIDAQTNDLIKEALIRSANGSSALAIEQESIRVGAGPTAICAFVVCNHTGAPSFLPGGPPSDKWSSLTVLVVVDGHLVVHTAGGARWSDTFIEDWADRVSPREVSHFLSVKGALFEKVGMRAMSLNRNVIRARSYEALELQSSLSPLGMNRQVIQTVRCRVGGRLFAANPATALIAESGDRVDLRGFVGWAHSIVLELPKKAARVAGFLGHFAQVIDIADLLKTVTPNAMTIDMSWLRDGHDAGTLRLERVDSAGRPKLATRTERDQLINILSAVSELTRIGSTENFAISSVPPRDLLLQAGKKSFSIAGGMIAEFSVLDTRSNQRASLRQRIRDEEAVFMTTNDLRYAFAFGKLFRDEQAYALAPRLLDMIQAIPALVDCQDEKGQKRLKPADKVFPANSVFRVVEDTIAQESFLICDDLSDEWADFIGIDVEPYPFNESRGRS